MRKYLTVAALTAITLFAGAKTASAADPVPGQAAARPAGAWGIAAPDGVQSDDTAGRVLNKIVEKVSEHGGALLGSIVGGYVGFAVGGPLGAAIGANLGALAGEILGALGPLFNGDGLIRPTVRPH